MAINSQSSVASRVSASFSQSATQLNSIKVTASSGETNVTGNSIAVESFSTFESSLKIVSNSVVQAGNNVHSVAKEFERIDQKVAQSTNFAFTGGLK